MTIDNNKVKLLNRVKGELDECRRVWKVGKDLTKEENKKLEISLDEVELIREGKKELDTEIMWRWHEFVDFDLLKEVAEEWDLLDELDWRYETISLEYR